MTTAPIIPACDHAEAHAHLRALPEIARVRCDACRAWVGRALRVANVYLAPAAPAEPPSRRARPAPLSVEAREESRVRTLLFALRPDCADPLRPPPPAPTAVPPVRIRDPMAGWGDVPGALAAPAIAFDDSAAAKIGAVLERLRELPEDARVVCTWLRHHAVLETLRGLYVDVGLEFADAAQAELWRRDLSARRDGAHALGRRIVLAAARAWGLPDV